MNEITTTLAAIEKRNLYRFGWKTLLTSLNKTEADDEPLSLLHILESNGLYDTLTALRAVNEKYDPAMRLYACFCARYRLSVFEKKYPAAKRPRKAIETIETAERFAWGQATKEELEAANAHNAFVAGIAACRADKDACRAILVATYAAAGAAALAAALAAGAVSNDYVSAANAAANTTLTEEFERFCRLEGDYGAVVKLAE